MKEIIAPEQYKKPMDPFVEQERMESIRRIDDDEDWITKNQETRCHTSQRERDAFNQFMKEM